MRWQVEIWALCQACNRWFYCADYWAEQATEPLSCPVCAAVPAAVVDRAAAATVEGSLRGEPAGSRRR